MTDDLGCVCACVCVFPRRRQFKRWTGDGTDGRIAPRLRKLKNARAAFPLRQPASSFSVFFTSSRSSFSLSSNSGFLSLSWECTSLPPKIRLSDAYPSLVVRCLRCDGSRQTSLSFFDCSLLWLRRWLHRRGKKNSVGCAQIHSPFSSSAYHTDFLRASGTPSVCFSLFLCFRFSIVWQQTSSIIFGGGTMERRYHGAQINQLRYIIQQRKRLQLQREGSDQQQRK